MAATGVQYVTGGPGAIAVERVRYGRSPAIWRNFPWLRVREEPGDGDVLWENFMSWNGAAVASNKGNYVGKDTAWTSFESTTTSTIQPSNTDFPIPGTAARALGTAGAALGVIKMSNATTAHNGAILELGGGANGATTSGAFALPPGATVTAPTQNQYPKLFFECRVRFVQNAGAAVFLGLTAPGGSATAVVIVSVADVFTAALNSIGFAVSPVASTGLATSSTKIQPYYGSGAIQAANQTNFTGNVGGIPSTADYPGGNTALVPAANAVAGVLTDFTKLGFVYDGLAPDGVVLKYFQDGVFLAGQTAQQIVAANWPGDVALVPTLLVKSTGAVVTTELDVDWVCTGQLLAQE